MRAWRRIDTWCDTRLQPAANPLQRVCRVSLQGVNKCCSRRWHIIGLFWRLHSRSTRSIDFQSISSAVSKSVNQIVANKSQAHVENVFLCPYTSLFSIDLPYLVKKLSSEDFSMCIQHSAYRPIVFTRESRMLRASLPSSGRLSVRLSVCLSVTLVDCIKTVQARITKSSLWAAPAL